MSLVCSIRQNTRSRYIKGFVLTTEERKGLELPSWMRGCRPPLEYREPVCKQWMSAPLTAISRLLRAFLSQVWKGMQTWEFAIFCTWRKQLANFKDGFYILKRLHKHLRCKFIGRKWKFWVGAYICRPNLHKLSFCVWYSLGRLHKNR